MKDIKKITENIYKFYPKNIKFYSIENEQSIQYLTRKSKISEEYNNIKKKNQIDKALHKIFREYNVIDWMDHDEPKCFEYIVLLHKNQDILDNDMELMEELNGVRIDLYLYISFLGEYYYYYLKKTTYDKNNNEWSSFRENNEDLNKKEKEQLENFFMKEKYIKIDNDIANILIDDIETQYKNKGEVTIFDCLFTDLLTPVK